MCKNPSFNTLIEIIPALLKSFQCNKYISLSQCESKIGELVGKVGVSKERKGEIRCYLIKTGEEGTVPVPTGKTFKKGRKKEVSKSFYMLEKYG